MCVVSWRWEISDWSLLPAPEPRVASNDAQHSLSSKEPWLPVCLGLGLGMLALEEPPFYSHHRGLDTIFAAQHD